jgi:hypothetical protein
MYMLDGLPARPLYSLEKKTRLLLQVISAGSLNIVANSTRPLSGIKHQPPSQKHYSVTSSLPLNDTGT